MRTSTVFKSRWMALVWAAGIIWFAVDYAGSHDSAPPAKAALGATSPAQSGTQLIDASGRPITAEDLKELSGGAGSN